MQTHLSNVTDRFICVPARLVLICGILSLLAGCGDSHQPPRTPETDPATPMRSAQPVQAEAPDQSGSRGGLTAKIKFKSGDGNTVCSVKPQDDGAKLVDASEKEIARFKLDDSKLKVKDANDTVLGYVIFTGGKYKIENADQSEELWKLQPQEDGDWKLEDGADELICKVKKRDYGFEIEDAAENSLYKIKLKSGKTSLRNPSDATVLYTKDRISTMAFTCMGLEAIDQQSMRAALMTMVILQSH